jgi:hypothetical protein
MNSLYGRFELNIVDNTYLKIVNYDEYNFLTDNSLLDINNSTYMNENVLINYSSNEKFLISPNASVAILSAITSYARIFIYQYMNYFSYLSYFIIWILIPVTLQDFYLYKSWLVT